MPAALLRPSRLDTRHHRVPQTVSNTFNKKAPPKRGLPKGVRCSDRLLQNDISRSRTLRCLLDIELHYLTLYQGPETRPLNRGIVHKYILAALLGRDKTETLGLIKPLDSTSTHSTDLL